MANEPYLDKAQRRVDRYLKNHAADIEAGRKVPRHIRDKMQALETAAWKRQNDTRHYGTRETTNG